QLPSLLANAFEALIGALFLDQGYKVAMRIFVENIGDLAEWTDANFKGRLQEAAQENFHETPIYKVGISSATGQRRAYRAEAIVGTRPKPEPEPPPKRRSRGHRGGRARRGPDRS